MPVNFETPDPGIIERPYVQQIPLDALFKNMAFGQAKYDQGLQAAKRSIDTLRNIKTYGHDTDIKNEMFRKLDQELAKFDGADFRDANTQMQLDSLISNFTSTKEIAGMHARGVSYEKMEKEEEDARLKGHTYYNPGLNEARKYYNDGVYRAGARFKDVGNIAPDFEAMTKEVLARPNVTYDEISYGPNGQIITNKRVDADKAAAAYKEILDNDKRFADYAKYQFELQHPEGTDWQAAGYNHFAQEHATATDLATQEYLAARYESEKAKPDKSVVAYHLKAAKEAEERAQNIGSILDPANPNIGTDYKSLWFDEYKKSEAEKFGKTKALLAPQKVDNDVYLENLRSANAAAREQKLAILKQQLDAGVYPDPLNPGSTIPGTAQIAGEKEGIKKMYSTNGTGVMINSNMDDFHRYARDSKSATDNPDFARDPAGQVRIVDLTKGVMENLGWKDPAYGKGWRQINNESFLKNWKKNNGIEINQNSPVLNHVNGSPEIYVKGDRIIVGVNEGNNKITYRDVNAHNLFAAEVNQASSKNAPLLTNSKEANISGNYSMTPPVQTKTVTSGGQTYKSFADYKKAYEDSILKRAATEQEKLELIQRWNAAK